MALKAKKTKVTTKAAEKPPGGVRRNASANPSAGAKPTGQPVVGMSSTVAAILGITAGAGSVDRLSRVKPEWRRFYQHLMELRERLVHQMGGLARESAEQIDGYSLHMADSGTDNFDRDFALSLLSADQDAVYEIDEALKRLMKGTYGVCELTGKPIPKARLEAIPWARFTVEAQAQLEKDGALRQRRLGSLGSIDSGSVIEVEEETDEDDRPTVKEKE